ncbi:hypothetical protein JW948_02830 [bacterium]|nr:hypothetical protein [bacterium]
MTRIRILFLCVLLGAALAAARGPGPEKTFPLDMNISAGIGYPQIPLSQFRPPIGVTGNVGVQWRIAGRWAVHTSVNAMKTFSLGTVTGNKATLRYNLQWAGGHILYAVGNEYIKTNYVAVGAGYYALDRQLDRNIDNVDTPGINLGFISHTGGLKARTQFELRWHLLFEPGDNPQVLTMTFGILI